MGDFRGHLICIISRLLPIQERSSMNLCGDFNYCATKLKPESLLHMMSKTSTAVKETNKKNVHNPIEKSFKENHQIFQILKKILKNPSDLFNSKNLKNFLVSLNIKQSFIRGEKFSSGLENSEVSKALMLLDSAHAYLLNYQSSKKNMLDYSREFPFCFVSEDIFQKAMKFAIMLRRKVLSY